MAAKSTAKSAARPASSAEAAPRYGHFCSVKPSRERQFAIDVHSDRAAAIAAVADKWVNGTVLSYYFFDKPRDGETVSFADGSSEFVSWKGSKAQQDQVRKAFKTWKDLGIGLEFKEVAAREQALLRIGFMPGDGSWSYVGVAARDIGSDQRTINFGWDLSGPGFDTALHEIGHALGFHHEHQNPFSGIVWDDEAVYAALARPPNRWDRQKTFYNIIRKLPEGSVQGTQWDNNSVMHYPFEAGLIKQPEHYRANPLRPAEQLNLSLTPNSSRIYEIRTFGSADTVIVLFEEQSGGRLKYVGGDDDSGFDRNAYLRVRLARGRRYVLRIRLYYADRAGETAVMWW
jgi:hypothetical protein